MDKLEIAYNADKYWPTANVTSSECYGCCGSGGMFVQSVKFVENHSGNQKDISIYGQEYTGTTYKLANMSHGVGYAG